VQQHDWAIERLQWQQENARQVAQIGHLTAINATVVAANQELAQANLALTGLHEDVLVRNEELQAATEEIKSLNEELQATNEELETLNEEQEATLEELRATNDDLLVRSLEVQALAAEREQQQRASEAQAAELHAILGSISDAVLVLAPFGEVRFTNATYATLFGMLGLERAADDNGVALPFDALPQQRARQGRPFRMTFTLPTTAGERRYYEATGAPIWVGEAREGSVITLRDITERNLRRLQEDFLALASHELRSPLTSLKAAAQMLARRIGSTDERAGTLLTTILRQLERLQQLIADLVDSSRLQHGKLRLTLLPVDLPELVAQTIAAFALGVPQPPIVIAGPPEGTLLIAGDAVRLEQILTNLLTNASKYAAGSPQIVVRLRQVDQDAEMQVADQGPGIAAADLPQLFQRFFQVQAEAETARTGLGLGLFLTHELVVAHGGHILVSSQVGQGTTFTMRFPLLSPPEPPPL
ncbi:MAG: hypothetical protein H0X24_07255, partial [Ktedonobacterales bacterium]|nr:hypothetical protein [Ktedonobacterales bacterium]